MGKSGEIQSIELRRVLRQMQEREPGNFSRKLFGLDFLFVIFFLVIAFYFFWPKLFQTPGQYVPETTVNQMMARWTAIQAQAQETATRGEPSAILLSSIQALLATETEVGLYIVDGQGQWVWGEAEKPLVWEVFWPNRPRQPLGCWVHAQKGQATLYFWGTLPSPGWVVVMAQPFPALFKP
ncbi:MAG: hypothetical protein RBU29_07940 [bacterium]|jgi:hypothetical protein|nr:hypothetical protein [bacterium]